MVQYKFIQEYETVPVTYIKGHTSNILFAINKEAGTPTEIRAYNTITDAWPLLPLNSFRIMNEFRRLSDQHIKSEMFYLPIDDAIQHNLRAFIRMSESDRLFRTAYVALRHNGTALLEWSDGEQLNVSVNIGCRDFSYAFLNTLTMKTYSAKGQIKNKEEIKAFYHQLEAFAD